MLLLGSNALFIATSFAVATWVNRRLGLSSVGDSAVVFARTGKHNGMAIAIAHGVLAPAATMLIFQLQQLVCHHILGGRLRRSYCHGHRSRRSRLDTLTA